MAQLLAQAQTASQPELKPQAEQQATLFGSGQTNVQLGSGQTNAQVGSGQAGGSANQAKGQPGTLAGADALSTQLVAQGDTATISSEGAAQDKSAKRFLDAGTDYRDKLAQTRDLQSPVVMDSSTKPWQAKWVFQGGNQQDPRLKPLLGESKPAAAQQEGLAGLMAQIQALGGEIEKLEADATQAGAAPQAAASNTQTVKGEQSASALMAQGLAPGQLGANTAQPVSVKKTSPMAGMSGADYLNARQSSKEATGAIGPEAITSMKERAKLDPKTKEEFEQSLSTLQNSLGAGAAGSRLEGTAAPKPEMPRAELTGFVTSGSMTRERLSSESIMNLTGKINEFGPMGGGQMVLNLKPGNLGQMKLFVMTGQGGEVSVRVQAANAKSKEILEESLGSLRESLANQNLKLGAVEVAVSAPAQSDQSSKSGLSFDSGQQNQASQQNMNSYGGSDGRNSRASERGESSGGSLTRSLGATPGGASAASSRYSNGRLDVRA